MLFGEIRTHIGVHGGSEWLCSRFIFDLELRLQTAVFLLYHLYLFLIAVVIEVDDVGRKSGSPSEHPPFRNPLTSKLPYSRFFAIYNTYLASVKGEKHPVEFWSTSFGQPSLGERLL